MQRCIVLGMCFNEHNQCDRKGIGRRLFLFYSSCLLSEVLYNVLNFICNCCDLLHLLKICDSYFLDTKNLINTFKSIQRSSSDFHLSTAEKHILWQRNCISKGKEERNILILSSEHISVNITGRDIETIACIVPSGITTWLMF